MPKKKKHRTRDRKNFSQTELQRKIVSYFQLNPKKRLNAIQIKKKLKLTNSRDSIHSALEILFSESKLVHLKEGKFKLNKTVKATGRTKTGKVIKGIVDMTRAGSAYIVCENYDPDIYVSARNLNGAFHNDRVTVEITRHNRKNKPEGNIIDVVQRANTFFIGTVQIYRNNGVVYVNHPKMYLEIFIPTEDLNDAEPGDMVIAEITEFGTTRNKKLRGVVKEVITHAGAHEIEMKSILVHSGFHDEFPTDVLDEIKNLDKTISIDREPERRDFREAVCFTIDPVDAKDFDDALSVQYQDGVLEIGVHIADVSHFVPRGSATDKNAFKKGNSVYLIDRVCPMLPETISNDLCSLKPGEDRYCFSVVYQLDKEYRIQSEWIGKSIIHSKHRFTYEEAFDSLQNPDRPFHQELSLLNKIAKKIRKKRFTQGSIDFSSNEVMIILDKDKKPVKIVKKEVKESHQLIEEWMLLANKTVANYIQTKGKSEEIPFVYRIHDEPDEKKLEEMAIYASELGVNIKTGSRAQIIQSLNQLADQAKTSKSLSILEPLAIKSMSKAVYSTDNIGHYGLSFENYTHFTSPIRRYADLMVHRILEKNLDGTHREDKPALESICFHISNQERKAQDAERDSVRYKQAEYMKNRIGESYRGTISAIYDHGILVVLEETLVEGLIGFDNFQEEFDLPMGKLRAVGKRSGKIFQMGQELEIIVSKVDVQSRYVYFDVI